MECMSKWEKSRGATKGERGGWGEPPARLSEDATSVLPPARQGRDFPFKSEPAGGVVGLIIAAEGQKGAGSSHSITVIVQVYQINI